MPTIGPGTNPEFESGKDTAMRRAHEDPELRELMSRYVTPGQRHLLLLGGGLLRMDALEREHFTKSLGHAAGEITPRELSILLEGGWRGRHTAAWLIAVARRTEFRDRLGELLLASEVCYAGRGYCVALAAFGTPADAALLASYLDHYLRRPDLDYNQPEAIGALLHLDANLGTDTTARFLTPGGLWQRWVDGPPAKGFKPQGYHRIMSRFCTIAAESRLNVAHRHERWPHSGHAPVRGFGKSCDSPAD